MSEITYQLKSPDGFGSNFFTVLTAINHCISQNLDAYINVINTSYTSENENCWEIIFKQPFGLQKDNPQFRKVYEAWDLGQPLFSYDGDTRNKFQDRHFIKTQRDIVKRYIKPHQGLMEKVEEFLASYKDKKILGIHRRGRDHFSSGHASGQNHKMSEDYIKNVIDTYIDDYDYLYLTSDENRVYEFLKNHYPNKFIYFDDKSEFSEDQTGLHFLNLDISKKTQMLQNLMVEVFILSKCDRMLLMNSNVSHMSLFFSEVEDFEFYDMHVNYR